MQGEGGSGQASNLSDADCGALETHASSVMRRDCLPLLMSVIPSMPALTHRAEVWMAQEVPPVPATNQ